MFILLLTSAVTRSGADEAVTPCTRNDACKVYREFDAYVPLTVQMHGAL
jgi:hypothetical protein